MTGPSAVLEFAVNLLGGFGWFAVGYFVLINTSFLALTLLAAYGFVSHLRRSDFAGLDEAFASPLTPPVSILVAAYNEEAGIVAAVGAMGSLRYPANEVIVVDDGSTDATFDVLAEAFDLAEVPRVIPAHVPTVGEVRSVHVSRQGARNVVVVRKRNGGRSDALNTGINVARYPLVCMVDADSILDPEALLQVTRPFAEDPENVVGSGGVVRPVNGCLVRSGRVVDVRMPRRWFARIQVVEYLRAFLVGRIGWSRLDALLVISGAFGLFRRDVIVEVGGLAVDCIGEDAELVVRIHRRLADTGRGHRMVFVAEPVCWTEVPESRAVLGSQRRRWARGLTEILQRHRRMILNPRYGRVGLVALPWFVLFEWLAPVVELVGYVVVAGLLTLGGLDVLGLVDATVELRLPLIFLAVSWGYSVLLTVVSLLLEEFSFHRYRRRRDLLTALAATLAENVGYRQLSVWWRIRGTLQALRRTPPEWGTMTRTGFAEAAPERVSTRRRP